MFIDEHIDVHLGNRDVKVDINTWQQQVLEFREINVMETIGIQYAQALDSEVCYNCITHFFG